MSYQFLYQQDNLEKICKDVPLVSPEIHVINDFYGQASVLKRYCGISETKSLKVVYEHSLKLHNVIWDRDAKAPFYSAFTSSLNRYKCFKDLKYYKFIVPIGAAILYAKKLVENDLRSKNIVFPKERKGTIVFPSHSTHEISAAFDYDHFAEKLNNLPDKFQPIVVCMYWKDYLDGKHQEYEKRGIHVVSAGHMYNKDFLLRFYDICRQFKYSFANSLGSDLFYSTLSGCQYFCDYSYKIDYSNPKDLDLHSMDKSVLENTCKAQRLFKEPSELTQEKRDFIESISGASYMRSKRSLLALITITELLSEIRYLTLLPAKILSKMKRVGIKVLNKVS